MSPGLECQARIVMWAIRAKEFFKRDATGEIVLTPAFTTPVRIPLGFLCLAGHN